MKTLLRTSACVLLASGLYAHGDDETTVPEAAIADSLATPVVNEAFLPEALTTLYDDGETSIKWGGRLFLDAGWFDLDSGFGDTGGGGASGADGFEFRTARFFASGIIEGGLDFKVDMEFEGNDENNFKDVYLSKKTSLGTVKIGHFKEPFSLEQLTSSRFITFMERSLADVFVPSRNIGLQLSRHYADTADLNWAFGVFKESADGGRAASDGEYNYTGRITGAPIHEGERVLHLGIGYTHRSDAAGMLNYRDEPEAHLVSNIEYAGGGLASDGADVTGLEFAFVQGPASVQAEYMLASLDGGNAGTDADYSGGYIQGSYFLTGEMRSYKGNGGVFERVKPKENFNDDFGGAWEAAVRYSMVDFNDATTLAETNNVTLGVNWYLNAHTRFMVNWINSSFENGAIDADGSFLTFRFQVDW